MTGQSEPVLHDRPVTSADAAELAALREELARTKARTELLQDPAWLEALSPAERDAERSLAEQIRALRREHELASALDAGRLSKRQRRVEDRLARMELADRMWSSRALARRKRLLDPTSRLAALQRTHVASSAALFAVALAGIAWTSKGVHDALVGPNGTALAYLVEPIFSVPLLVIMALSAQAAQWNRAFPPRHQRGRVYSLEGFLLLATVAMNTVSVLPGLGAWQGVATLLAHLVPPVLTSSPSPCNPWSPASSPRSSPPPNYGPTTPR